MWDIVSGKTIGPFKTLLVKSLYLYMYTLFFFLFFKRFESTCRSAYIYLFYFCDGLTVYTSVCVWFIFPSFSTLFILPSNSRSTEPHDVYDLIIFIKKWISLRAPSTLSLSLSLIVLLVITFYDFIIYTYLVMIFIALIMKTIIAINSNHNGKDIKITNISSHIICFYPWF